MDNLIKTYRVLIDRKRIGQVDSILYIDEKEANLLWMAYMKQNPHSTQTMDRREQRGGICWWSEIKMWKKNGSIEPYFKLKELNEL